MVWITCVLLWCFYQLFGLSFWRHPFTAEHPLLRQWRNKLILVLYEGNDGDIFRRFFFFGKLLKWLFYCIATLHFWCNNCKLPLFTMVDIRETMSNLFVLHFSQCIPLQSSFTESTPPLSRTLWVKTAAWMWECLYLIIFVSLHVPLHVLQSKLRSRP